MDQYALSEALQNRLVLRQPTLQVGIGDLPVEIPNHPYAIIFPLGVAETYGTYDNPQDTAQWMLQIRSVGKAPIQTAWLQEFIRDTIMSRSGSGFTYSLAVSGVEPEHRELLELGPVTEADSELHQSDDTYQFRRSFT